MKSVLLVSSLLALTYANCPDNWTEGTEGICYQFEQNSQNIQRDASYNCQRLGGNLPMIKNVFENGIVAQKASATKAVWVGITCTGSDITDCYYDDRTPLTTKSYNNFLKGKPDTSEGECVYMLTSGNSAGKWRNIDCDALSFYYVCQINENIVDQPCEPGFFLHDKNGQCYSVLMEILPFVEAENACSNMCSHVATPTSLEENTFLTSLIKNTTDTIDYIHLGIVYYSGKYIDSNTDKEITYSNFGHKDNELGDCVGLSLNDDIVLAGTWINTYCNKRLLSVCQAPPNATPCKKTASTTYSPITPSYTCDKPQYLSGNGIVRSPQYPSPYYKEDCTYIISEPKGQLAQVQFTDIQLDTSSSIELYYDPLDKVPFQILNTDNAVGITFISQEPSMKIIFRTSYQGRNNRWSFNYSYIENNLSSTPSPCTCNCEQLDAPGVITSPNYPDNYPEQTSCSYSLRAQMGKKIRINFTDVHTSYWDVITVYDSMSANERIGGTAGNQTKTFTSSGRYMYITFITEGKYSDRGFSANFFEID